MNPLLQLGRQVQYLFIPVLLASFAVEQSVQAEPNEDHVIANVIKEDNPVPHAASDAEEAAVGQAANDPNQRVIPVNIKKSLQCAGGDVVLHANLVVTFKHVPGTGVLHHSVKLERFRGTAVAGNRTLAANKTKFIHTGLDLELKENGMGFGRFGGVEFEVTGPGLPGGSPLRFIVKLGPIRYEFRDGKVTKIVSDDAPFIKCQR